MSDFDVQDIAKQLVSLRDVLRFSVSQMNRAEVFFGHGTDNAWDDSLSLLLSALHLPVSVGDEVLDARLTDAEKLDVLSLLKQRVNEHVPVPYLVNKAWFAGLSFYVDERVLIPRSPIFELIQEGFQPWYHGEYPERILDLCTGSGCIGIACAYAFDEATVELADLSADALAVADINIKQHGLLGRVSTVESDLFANIEGGFDIIVSNPPYVDAEDFSSMPKEFKHEPAMALESGNLGLDHPLQILRCAADYLTDDGVLILELGNSGMHLERCYPDIEFNWLQFEFGGQGVLAISREELIFYAEQLAVAPAV